MDPDKLKFDLVLEEYKQLRAELLQTMSSARGVVQFHLLAAGLVAASISTIIDKDQEIMLMVFPLVFFALLLVFLRYMIIHIEVTNHLKNTTIQQLRVLLKEVAIDDESERSAVKVDQVLCWHDMAGWKDVVSRYPLMLIILPASPALIPLAAMLSCYFAFFYFNINEVSNLEKLLMLINPILWIYGVWLSLVVAQRKYTTN